MGRGTHDGPREGTGLFIPVNANDTALRAHWPRHSQEETSSLEPVLAGGVLGGGGPASDFWTVPGEPFYRNAIVVVAFDRARLLLRHAGEDGPDSIPDLWQRGLFLYERTRL